MTIPASDLNTLCVTCDHAATEAVSITDLRDTSAARIALERIHRDLIDGLAVIGRLQQAINHIETGANQ